MAEFALASVLVISKMVTFPVKILYNLMIMLYYF